MGSARSVATSAGLGLVLFALLGWGLWEWTPWLWPRLFPAPPVTQSAGHTEPLTVDVVERAFDQALVAAGGELPGRPAGDRPIVTLPRGLAPRALQDALRADPRLAHASLYLTQADDLLWRLRVYEGPRLVTQRDVRPWMSSAPPHPPANPPELVVLFDGRAADDAWLRRVVRWRSPVAVVLVPFDPKTLRRADEIARASREVVAVVDPAQPLADQLAAVPHASAVLLEATLPGPPAAWLAVLAGASLVLIDACPEGCIEADVAREAGVDRLRLATRLRATDPDERVAEVALIRNLAVRRGYGVFVADGTKAGAGAVEELLDAATADGLPVVFAAEAAQQHSPRQL